jgi:hypothetical protein
LEKSWWIQAISQQLLSRHVVDFYRATGEQRSISFQKTGH